MLTKILALLAKLDAAQIRSALAAIAVIVDLFSSSAPVPPSHNLESTQVSIEDQEHLEVISEKLSSEGVQTQFDLQRLLRFVALLRGLFGATGQ